MAELETGKSAPQFKLPRDGGGEIDFAALRGRPVVLFFYLKDDTPACTNEAIAFSGLKAEFDRLGAALIGISPDTARKHDRFKARHGLTVDLAADAERKTVLAYGVWAEKTMFGVKYMGVERTTFLIRPSGRIARIWRKVKVAGHAEEVLEAVRTLK